MAYYQWEIGFDWHGQKETDSTISNSGVGTQTSTYYPAAMGLVFRQSNNANFTNASAAQMVTGVPAGATSGWYIVRFYIYDITNWGSVVKPNNTNPFALSDWSFNISQASSGGSQTDSSPLFDSSGTSAVNTIDSTNYSLGNLNGDALSYYFGAAATGYAFSVGPFQLRSAGRFFVSTAFKVSLTSAYRQNNPSGLTGGPYSFSQDPEMIIDNGT